MPNPWDDIDDPVENFLRDVQENGLENSMARRYYAKYEALVVSNRDPQQQGRVLIRVFVLKRRDTLDVWAYPSALFAGPDYGAYFPPEEGDHVWAWFDHGKPSYPGISGGWWLAPKRNAASSHLPSEFKELVPDTSPTKRGIKTKKGHALLFDDSDTNPQVQLWSGQQAAEGVDAIKRNVISLSDEPGQERLTLETFVGHALRLVDSPVGSNGITMETLAGIRLFFDETLQLARIETPAGREIVIDDLGAVMSIFGLTGQIDINDGTQTLDITSVGQINITGNGVNINSSAGVQQQQGAGNIDQTFTGNKTVTLNGNETKNVNGNETHNVVGTYQKQITGTSTLTFLGGLIMAITGALVIGGALTTAIGLTIAAATPAAVTLGAATGIFFRLVTENFITQYNANVAIHNANVAIFNAHFHPFIGNLGVPGVTTPTATPQTPIAAVAPDSALTTVTVAN